MEKYLEPKFNIIELETAQVLCASFDPFDKTEKWEFDDEETI